MSFEKFILLVHFNKNLIFVLRKNLRQKYVKTEKWHCWVKKAEFNFWKAMKR